MDMTRRQFALALAAATSLRPSLFEPLSPSGVPHRRRSRPESPGRTIRRQRPGMAQVRGGPMLITTSL